MADQLRARVDGAEGRAQYRLTWAAVILGSIAAPAVLIASGMVVAFASLAPYGALLGLLLACHYVYSLRRPNEAISLVTGGAALMIAAALLAGIVANAGLRLRYPLIDGSLARADLALGIDTPALVLAVAAHPWLAELLGQAYVSIFPLAFATAIWLSLRRQKKLLWELTLGFAGGIVGAAIVSVFFPALGNIAHAGLRGLAGTRLTEGSGVYFLDAVSRYRDGTDPLLDASKLEGVVCFPSFHMVMAAAVAYAFRTTRWLALPVACWCALVVVSTVPNGGHYVVDLIAGFLLWIATLALAGAGRFIPSAGRGPISRMRLALRTS
jgi:membrane-associated phospholipid phosphatase